VPAPSSTDPPGSPGAELPAEFALIASVFRPLATSPAALALGDDAALLDPPPGRTLVLAADAMVEGVHFLPDDPAGSVGQKLLRVNLSDLAAMGAEPLGYLLTVALPKGRGHDWIQGVAAGLALDQARFGLSILGGDTVGTTGPACLSLTILGHVEPGRALRRAGAAAGDRVWVSGSIGDGALGLDALQGRLGGLPAPDRAWLASRYRLPEPRLGLGQRLGGIASACLDVSDGLLQDLGHLMRAAGASATIERDRIPLSPAARVALDAAAALWPRIWAGGDDYELLFTAPLSVDAQVRQAAAAAGVMVTPIGLVGPPDRLPVYLRNPDGSHESAERGGWSHL